MSASVEHLPDRADRRRDRWLRLGLALVVIAAVVAFYATGLHERLRWEVVRGQVSAWQQRVEANLLLAAAAFFCIYVAFTALSLPAALMLSLIAGALFERIWLGVLIVSVASTCGASLAFLGSRYLFRDWVRRRFADRLKVIDRGVERDGAWYLFMLRLTPVVPYFLINLGMALTPMRLRTFATVSLLGMLPASVVIVNAGTQLGQIEKPADALSPAVMGSLALLGIAPLVIRLVVRRWQGAEQTSNP